MSIDLQRAYERDPLQGSPKRHRFLVDRLWPRGIKKADLSLEGWAKDVAPSDRLRQWFGHDPRRWHEFQSRYRRELAAPEQRERLQSLLAAAGKRLTLVYGAKDEKHNQALVLRDLLSRQAKRNR